MGLHKKINTNKGERRLKRIAKTLAVFTLLLVLLSACARTERPLTADELLNLGEKYLLEMNYEQALVQFLAVIEVERMNPRGYMGAAEAYVGLGDTDSAVQILQDGLNVLPDSSEIQELLGRLRDSAVLSRAGDETGETNPADAYIATDDEYRVDTDFFVGTWQSQHRQDNDDYSVSVSTRITFYEDGRFMGITDNLYIESDGREQRIEREEAGSWSFNSDTSQIISILDDLYEGQTQTVIHHVEIIDADNLLMTNADHSITDFLEMWLDVSPAYLSRVEAVGD